ncbi:LysR family transcriptional regulator [Bordetella sp. 15P40C-2]|uniref:LysR family transcriptional regulator n=1 Tax=Bordetella sp. 15P40C-2 TaxID=2572246 RepID=UPI0013281E94|nr:LysR family transcriptional regulator [Bordetella sp. 15P40C-2]MVW72707.1 LysR family transcriptional regulator [Bordetella sp. 15P40C-2]
MSERRDESSPLAPSRAMTTRLDLMTLRLFVSVVEHGGIVRAAQSEFIATSAVSKRIQDLESALRTPLLVRQRQGVIPTEAGNALIRHARRLLRAMAEMETELLSFADGERGNVRVMVSESALTDFFPTGVKAFSEAYPNIFIDLVGGLSPSIQRAVADETADIGVLVGSVTEPGLEVSPCRFRDLLVLVMAPQHPLAQSGSLRLNQLAGHPIIEQEPNSSVQRLLRSEAARTGTALQARIRVASFEAACNMAAEGLGVGVVPMGFARRIASYQPLVIVHLDEPWAHREYKVCVKQRDQQPKAVELLVSYLTRGGPLA